MGCYRPVGDLAAACAIKCSLFEPCQGHHGGPGNEYGMIEASSGRKLCHTIRGLESIWSNSVVGISLPTTKILGHYVNRIICSMCRLLKTCISTPCEDLETLKDALNSQVGW